LTCFEWHGSQQWWQPAVLRGFEGNGPWAVRVARDGRYSISLRRWPAEADAAITAAVAGGKAIVADEARLRIGSFDQRKPIPADAHAVEFIAPLAAGSYRLQSWFTTNDGTSRGAYYATVRRLAEEP
jgi:hypothetical protein